MEIKSHHPQRDARFEHINKQIMAFHAAGQPVIPVDTKKKELVGDYKNSGSDYRPAGCPDKVSVHDCVDKELGKTIPYGVYDVGANAGCVSVGIDHDMAEFAVNAIRRWHEAMGCGRYPASEHLPNHAGWRRFQWQPRPAVEDRVAKTCRHDGRDPYGLTVDFGRRIDLAITPIDWPRAFNKPICSLSSSDKCE